MSDHDDEAGLEPGRAGKRRRIAAGAAGLAAVLGAGAYVITAQVTDRNQTAATTEAEKYGSIDSVTTTPPSPNGYPPRPAASLSLSVEERLRRAREAASPGAKEPQPALTTAPGVKAATGVLERTESVADGSMRIITARSDLTGQRELLWAADQGERLGAATCTQNFRFSGNQKPAVRPTMLLCWRTSATRSVVTVLVDRDGKPSADRSVAVIDREWARLS